MLAKAPTLPAMAACPPLPCQAAPLLLRRGGGCGPLRADHGLPLGGAAAGGWRRPDSEEPRRRLCRTLPQLLPPHAASPPVAQVLPIKRRQAADVANDDDADCRQPSPKLARIATNPLCRRRSREPPAAAVDTPSRLFAVADVAFPPLTPSLPPPPPSPQPQQPLAVKRDAQTSPGCPASPAATPGGGVSGGGGGVSLSSWVRSARCRLAAHLRRSLSASRVGDASSAPAPPASADASTPKRLGGDHRRKRHASLQRLVQRLTASPFAASADASQAAAASPTAVRGRVLQLLPDGSRAVRLQRPQGAKFGFFVARQQDGVYLSRFNDQAIQLRYRSVIGVGDQILEIEGHSTASMALGEMHRFISDRRALVMRVRSPYTCAW